MKKRIQKMIALGMAGTMMMAMLAGCGAENNSATNGQKESSASGQSQPAASSSAAQPSSEKEEAKEFSYPLEGNRTISYSTHLTPGLKTLEIESNEDTEWAKAAEEATGIDVEWLHNGAMDGLEWYNLMFMDGNYPDIMQYNWPSYPGGLLGAYNDGIAIELNDVIDQYMPNYKAWLDANPDLAKQLRTDDGKYYAIAGASDSPSTGAAYGFYYRDDILKEMGEEVPETIEEWHDLLVKVKEKYNMDFAADAGFLSAGSFANAYIPTGSYVLDPETGKVVHNYTSDAFKEFLTVMAQWYKEGLINPDFATLDGATIKNKMLNNEVFASLGWAGSTVQSTMLAGRKINPDFSLAPAPIAKKDASSEVLYNRAVAQANYTNGVIISTQCEDVEAAARYLDYWWSEEGTMLSNFGIEGVSYTVENGVPKFTELLTNNPDGIELPVILEVYLRMGNGFPGLQTAAYYQEFYREKNIKDCFPNWGGKGSNQYDLDNLGLSFTTEESESNAQLSTAIATLVKEMRVKFVLGEADIEKEWDAYVKAIQDLKVADVIANYQAAYDRLLNR